MSKLSQFQKTITALVSGVIGWAAVVIASPASAISASEWLMLAVAGATALGVYAVPNIAPKISQVGHVGAADAGLSLLEALVVLAIGLAFVFASHSAGWW